MRECDIKYQNGPFWVSAERKAYNVWRDGPTHAVGDCAFPKTPDGLSLAIARADYLANRKA